MCAELQKNICKKYATEFEPVLLGSKIGIALNVKEGIIPINGLRHKPEGSMCGWFLWAGESLSDADDFFNPLHIEHLTEWAPEIIKFLGLPAGWRFIKAGDYEDVWFDETLL
jgi:hypothetical protein